MKKKTLAEATHLASDTYRPLDVVSVDGRAFLKGFCKTHGELRGELRKALAVGALPCPGCRKDRQGSRGNLLTLEDWVVRFREVHGDTFQYTKLSRPIKGLPPTITTVCAKHGEFETSAQNHWNGSGCKMCADEAHGNAAQFSEAEIKANILEFHGNKLAYVAHTRAKGFLEVVLNCGVHGNVTKGRNEYRVTGCPGCANNTVLVSKPLLEIEAFFKSLGCTTVLEFHLANRYRFDLLVDDHLLIEYNGNYWHSSEYRKSSTHADKQKLGEDSGSRVIQVFSDEWDHRKEQVKAVLANAAHKATNRCYARNTVIKELYVDDARPFLNQFHIQGASSGGEYVGLYLNEELVTVANYSYSEGRQASSNIELKRYATNQSVVGGLGKITAYLLTLAEQVSSFSDKRMFTGNAYAKAGYVKAYDLPPDYWYLEDGLRKHKAGYQKSRLLTRFGADFCGTLTEREITEKAGIYRIYDAGKIKWIATRKPSNADHQS